MVAKKLVDTKSALQFMEDWRNGKSCKFKPGEVVESGSCIGVVQFGLATYGEYQVKWYVGPKPWNFIDGKGFEKNLKKSDKPNPLKYKYSDMIPGPSSDAIDKLNARFKILDEQKYKERTGKEVDAYVSALEEEMTYKKEMKKVADKDAIDKIVADEDDDDVPVISEIDPVSAKREKIISED